MKTITKIVQAALAALTFGFLALGSAPKAFGVVPPPDGGYANFTTAEGTNALKNLTTGAANTAVGWYSLFSDTNGSFNTAVGAGTLVLNVGDQSAGEGIENTAVGAAALLLNTTGSNNTAVGVTALLNNDTGFNNTATGVNALSSNTLGSNNTATGAGALSSNTQGQSNTAVGVGALVSNTMGGGNTATGVLALNANQTGTLNTATGLAALQSNTTGGDNTAVGAGALSFNTTGDKNTAVGSGALADNTSFENTAVGFHALTHDTGSTNTALGSFALENNASGASNVAIGRDAGSNQTTGSFNIYIGAEAAGVAGEDSTIRIGAGNLVTRCFIAGINGASIGGVAQPVWIDSNNQLGPQPSSRRFKKEIRPMDKASEVILALRPVTFHYKHDTTNTPQFGLVAEEVAEVNPDLVVPDKNGEIYSVRYEAVNAMLLNEFLKEHKRVEELECTVREQGAVIAQQQQSFESRLAAQDKRIGTLTSGLQTVIAQVEMSKPSTRVVSNHP